MSGDRDCRETLEPGDASDVSLSRRERRWAWAVSIALVLAVFAVFGQTVRFDFVNFDDDVCVSENPHVSKGLTTQDITWAFTQKHEWLWQPLTWLSLMVDREVFGRAASISPSPAGFISPTCCCTPSRRSCCCWCSGR